MSLIVCPKQALGGASLPPARDLSIVSIPKLDHDILVGRAFKMPRDPIKLCDWRIC